MSAWRAKIKRRGLKKSTDMGKAASVKWQAVQLEQTHKTGWNNWKKLISFIRIPNKYCKCYGQSCQVNGSSVESSQDQMCKIYAENIPQRLKKNIEEKYFCTDSTRKWQDIRALNGLKLWPYGPGIAFARNRNTDPGGAPQVYMDPSYPHSQWPQTTCDLVAW